VCDTLYVRAGGSAWFAKSSDRPVGEVQLVAEHPARPPGGVLRTQYLELEDRGARATLLARPEWLWGAEHGLNVDGVAVGNEKVYTVVDADGLAPALIGMDLVRLGLERAGSADEAVAVVTDLLERHGQGGVADAAAREAYCSSFLLADATGAWVLETAGRVWAARRHADRAAISNRLVLRDDWQLGSAELAPRTDFGSFRNPEAPTGHADVRLAASERFCDELCGRSPSRRPAASGAAAVVAHLRDHGSGPWGAPGGGGPVVPPPALVLPDGTGVSICLHVRGYQATTSSMVAELAPPAPPGVPRRAWVALGSPCVTPFVPVFLPGGVPAELGSAELWRAFARLRDLVEEDGSRLEAVRSVVGPLEDELWEEADEVAHDPSPERVARLAGVAGARLSDAARAALDAVGGRASTTGV
jgi:hypothetical protein